MRKNGINRELRPIDGGVCAPEGYKANAVACGIRKEGGLDFGMIFSERRCAVACVYATGKNLGAPVRVSKKNMRNGYARAILVNGGVANAVQAGGEKLALGICDLFFVYGLERTEIVNASTGYMGERLRLSSFQSGVKSLWDGLAASDEHSRRVAEAIRADREARQLSFSFDIGDYPCKIGCVFKGGIKTSPNMATFLAFLTTDANISTPMLQKALEAEVRETLNQLNAGGAPSPNDTVCIMANGRAGNYKIACEDSEYKKFCLALRAVLTEICLITARDENKKLFTCLVKGAQSKQVARTVSKALVGAQNVKEGLLGRSVGVEDVLYVVLAQAKDIKAEKIRVFLLSKKGSVCLYEEDLRLPATSETLERIISAEEIELVVDFQDGNFQARAWGNLAE